MQQDVKIRNLVTDTLDEHRVHRQFLDKDVPERLLERILMSAIRSPSSTNGQSVTYLVVRDQAKREQVASLCGKNPHIAQAPVFILFATDFNRAKQACDMEKTEMVAQDSLETLIVGSVDCGIALSNAIVTAESLGLAVCPIGSVRAKADEIGKLFELPQYVFGMVGLVLGYAKGTLPVKPRFAYETLVHQETYKNEGIKEAIEVYNEDLDAYNKQINHTSDRPAMKWSERIAMVLNRSPYPNLKKQLKEKGFKHNK